MSEFLNVVKAFGELKAPQVSGPATAILDTPISQTLTVASDGTVDKLARVSPLALTQLPEAEIDKQIEEKLKSDEPLLQRVKAIFTSLDDKKNFLSNLDEVEKLHSSGNIKFREVFEIRDPSSVLRRLAFQFTFIGFSSPVDSAFKLRCVGYPQKMLPEATHRGTCSRDSYLYYWITTLDNDESRFVLDGTKPVFPRELVEDAEVAHVVQYYLKDLLGIKQENLISPDQFVMFMEIPEHLKVLFYKSLQESDFDMSQGLSLGTGVGFFMEGHLNAKPVSDRLITKLLDWEKRNLINRKDLPQCIRAYTVIFSLVDPKEICIEGNEQIRQLMIFLERLLIFPERLLISEVDESKTLRVQEIEKVLRNHSNTFKARGLQESDFALIREVAANLSKSSGDLQSKTLEFNKLGPVLTPICEQQKQFEQEFINRIRSSILSIDDPKTLFEVARKTIENGGYVPPKD